MSATASSNRCWGGNSSHQGVTGAKTTTVSNVFAFCLFDFHINKHSATHCMLYMYRLANFGASANFVHESPNLPAANNATVKPKGLSLPEGPYSFLIEGRRCSVREDNNICTCCFVIWYIKSDGHQIRGYDCVGLAHRGVAPSLLAWATDAAYLDIAHNIQKDL